MANRFWVGGAGNWSDTAKWSTTSGGAGGASVPGTADVAVFDAASDSGTAFTATVDTAFTITTLNISAVDVLVTIGTAGNLTCSTSTTVSASAGTNGVLISGNASLGAVTLTSGTLNIDGNTVTMSSLTSANATTRTFNFGTNGVVTLTGNAATIWNCTVQGTSTTSGTGTVNCTYSGGTGTRTILNAHDTGNANATFNITAGTDTVTFSTSNAVNSLSFTGFSGTWTNTTLSIAGSLTVSSGMTVNGLGATVTFTATTSQTITSSGKTLDFPITFNGVGGTWTLQDALTVGNTRATNLTAGTLSLGSYTLSTGSFVCSNANTRTLDFGTGKIQITYSSTSTNLEALEGRTLTNLTVSGTAPLIEFVGSGNKQITWSWGSTAGGTAARAVSLSFLNTGANTFVTQGASSVLNVIINCSLATWNIGTAGSNLYGNFTITAVGTLPLNSGVLSFLATSGTQDVTTNGKTLDFPVTINAPGATVRLQDALTMGASRTLTLTAGTFNANNFNVTTGLFASSNSNTRTITMGSGTWTLSGTGTVWNTATTTNLTFNKDTANIVLSDTSVTARTFAGGGLTYNNLTIGGTTGISTLTFTGSNTFSTLASTKTVAHTILFTAGTTTTVSSWTITGTVGNVVTIGSVTAATHTLTKTGGGVISGLDYLSISQSSATPSSTWYAGANSTDGGSNTGWIFTAAPATNTGNFFLMFN